MRTWTLLGAGVVLAMCALPFLSRAALRPRASDPTSLHQRLGWALTLSAALLVVPLLAQPLLPALGRAPVHVGLAVLASTGFGAGTPAALPPVHVAISPFAVVGMVWSAICAVSLLRKLAAALRLRAILARARSAPAGLIAQHQRVARALGVERCRLCVSDEVAAPFAFGLRTPTVVVPELLIDTLDEPQLDLVLHHELLHVQRGDLLRSLLFGGWEVLFPGLPAARRALREVCLARELAVDALVARPDPHAYATLLVEVASLAQSGPKLTHVSMDDTALTRRIDMLTRKGPAHPKRGPRAVIATAVAAAGVGIAASHVLASPPPVLVGPVVARADGKGPLTEAQKRELELCFVEARNEDPDLVIDTEARIEVTGGRVTSVSVPAPNSPAFQSCAEERAASWSFEPPSEADLPPPPPDAHLRIMFRIRLPAP